LSPAGTGSGDESACVWYVARGGKNQQEGPFSLETLKEQAASGNLAPDDLAWREGLAGWAPARDVPGLFAQPGTSTEMLRPVAPSGVTPPWVRKIVEFLTHPMFFFLAGLVFAVAAVLTVFGSLIGLVLWGLTWFDGAVSFVLLFIVCEAACGVLEILRRGKEDKREASVAGHDE
jgi:hypothetical protein